MCHTMEISFRELQKRGGKVLEDLPIIITRYGQPVAVLERYDTFKTQPDKSVIQSQKVSYNNQKVSYNNQKVSYNKKPTGWQAGNFGTKAAAIAKLREDIINIENKTPLTSSKSLGKCQVRNCHKQAVEVVHVEEPGGFSKDYKLCKFHASKAKHKK